MRPVQECYSCLVGLIRKTAELATSDPERRAHAVREGLAVLDRDFARGRVPTQIAGEAQRVVREITGNPDPFRTVKDREMAVAARLITGLQARFAGDLAGLMRLAVLGNAVDFFRELDEAELARPVKLYRDEVSAFEQRLNGARQVLYLADNAGELYFDYPLFRYLAGRTSVTYVVKDGPVQNDLTADDISRAGFGPQMPNIMTTGTDTPGVDLELVSPGFRDAFDRADLILAKGMGNYETLSEMAAGHRVFFLLMAKCDPVARSLGVPRDSFVASFSSKGG
ncbi:MAG: ARMT1-like domain-containing protein [Bacillota bacterium]